MIDGGALVSRLSEVLGVTAEWHTTIDSTNARARELGRAGAADNSLVIADAQTAGRGRRGREWYSPSGGGLYVSLLVREGAWLGAPELAQLAAGVAVAETVHGYGASGAELVWPNDCHVGGRKLAGVLVEAEAMAGRLQFLVCGIGLNVDLRAERMPESLRTTATDLAAVAHRSIDRATLAIDLLGRLLALRRLADAGSGARILERWRRCAPMAAGAWIEVETPAGRLLGRTGGVAEDGALMVEVDGQMRRLIVGEVVRVRRHS